MKGSSFLAELKHILANRKTLIPILAVAFVPVLYAGLFLWAFWNPYDHLADLPVAVVNQDEGAVYQGDHLKLGNELVDKLKDSDTFQFHVVDKKSGYQDLRNQKYYILVEIPKNFSKNATTLLDDHPEKLAIKYVPNEGDNFLSGQIGETAMKEIKAEISKKVTATYAENMFDKVKDMADGLDKASEGAGELNDGAVKLQAGSKEIKDNLELLAAKSIEFNQGVEKAHAGATDLAAGTGQVKSGLSEIDTKLPDLVSGTKTAKLGAEKIKTELPKGVAAGIQAQLNGSAGKLNAGIDQFETQLGAGLSSGLTDGIATGLSEKLANQLVAEQTSQMQELMGTLLKNGVPEATVNQIAKAAQQKAPTKEQLQAQLQQQLQQQLKPQITGGVAAGLDNGFTQFKKQVNDQLQASTVGLADKIKSQTDPAFNQLIGGISTINENQVKLQQGIHQLYEGSSQLDAGATDLTAGMNELSVGSAKMTDGTNKLATGSGELTAGTEKLVNGATELKEKLADGATEAASVHANDETYNMMGEPVKVDNKGINKVPNYGTGFAPYFISLGLFVGALLISIVFKLRDPIMKPASGLRWFFSKFGVIAIIGVIQAILVDVILLLGLGIETQSVSLFILTSIIISFTFMALIQMFVTIMGDPGRFIAIVILVLQLTTSAGTFPLELIPRALQPINLFLPMTYSVQSFKAVISTGDFAVMWQNNFILLAYMLGFMIVTAIYFIIKFKRQNIQIDAEEIAV